MLELTIDRRSPIPLYFQMSQQLEDAIRQGVVKPGERIETEVELAERYGLSRPTVRQAIAELVSKGLLVRRRGVGTQVVQSRMSRPVELTSLYDDLSLANHQPTTRLLTLSEVPADEAVAFALGITEGSSVRYLERVRLDGGAPLSILHNWLPIDLLSLDAGSLESTGLYALMRRAGIHMRVANQRIGASAATSAEARLLEVKSGSPLLTMERTTYDANGRAIEYAKHCYRADSFSFETTLVDR